MKGKARNSNKHQWLVLLTALAVIAVSVSSTLYFTGFLGGGGEASSGSNFVNVTFTDAYIECESYTRERYADRMQSLVGDNHSSRFDQAAGLYRMYFQLQMRKPPTVPQAQPYWVNCFVSSRDGRIRHFEVGEAKNLPEQPLRREADPFGWPR